MNCESEYQAELGRIVTEQVYQQAADGRSSIVAKQEEIKVLDADRPETKQDYLAQNSRLQAELEELVQQLRQLEESVHESAAADPTNKWAAIRVVRDRRIAACDWTQIPDAPLTDETRAAWQAYRQALRDTPQTYGDPDEVAWPEPPDEEP